MKSIVGKILCDRYRIVQQLSQNDWSTVYLAEDLAPSSPQQCQIEQLQPQYKLEILGTQAWQKVLQKFEAQGNVLMKVSQHPQIPQLLAFFECDRQFYLVREYIQGITLEQKLNDSLINESEALTWLKEILGVLESIHQLGMTHLNIQPSSLIEHVDGKKFLTNFAALKNVVLFENQNLKQALNPDFSPQTQPAKSDFSSDIHALGKTIIYALTGILSESIQAKSDIVISRNLTNLNPSPKANIRPELARILNKMVASAPRDYYQAATEILNELDFKQNQDVVTFPPPFANGFSLPQKSSSRVKSTRAKSTRVKSTGKTRKRISPPKSVRGIIWFLLSLPFIVASVIIFVGLNKNSEGNLAKINYTEYLNSDYQFSLDYPQTWSERQIDDPITGEVVVFTSPKETEADLYTEKVYLAVEYLSSEPTNLERYRQTVLNRINQTDNGNLELHQDFKSTIDDSPARTVIYSRQQGGLQLQQMESFMIKNNQVYIAIYIAERQSFDKFYPMVEKMIDSWEIE
jgi:eukaryotic-like serine/threonine-protein kinase